MGKGKAPYYSQLINNSSEILKKVNFFIYMLQITTRQAFNYFLKICRLIGERSELSVGRWMEKIICMHAHMRYIYICMHVHNPESARIITARLKKWNGRLGILVKDTLDPSNGRKRLQIWRPKERNLELHATCLVNSYQGKDAGVLFRLNYPIHKNTGIGWDTTSWR